MQVLYVTIALCDGLSMEMRGCASVLLAGLGLVAVVAVILVLRHRRRAVRGPPGKGLDSGDSGGQAVTVVVSPGPATPHQPARQGADLGVTVSAADDVAADVARCVCCTHGVLSRET